MRAPEPECLLRPGDACRLCQPGAHGPEDCPLVGLVLDDPELRAQLCKLRGELLVP
ncbi:DUF6767 domain-containing protein [Nocardioides sp.]|uniref:DUF6767 domain-containing protein n=1 Tax=Nocardioides sp. TaxID=35761 RepID=UPI0025D44961|nr:DUF6767 domain-containing protein [Nocardioides sp.]